MQSYFKKSQIGMMETIFIIIVFIIILLIAIYYYANFRSVGLKETAKELDMQQQEILLASIYTLPEIKCEKDDCIDVAKLIAAKKVISKNINFYNELFGKKTIKIELLYPRKKEAECTLEEYAQKEFPDNCNLITLYNELNKEEKTIISTPISLYFPSIEQYRIGRITIEQ